MTQTFSQFCGELGLPLRNSRWSWCAISEERRQAVFTVWKDRLLPDESGIDFSWLADPTRTENGAIEFRTAIQQVVDHGFDAYGILCIAKDPDARPRQRKDFKRDLLILDIKNHDDKWLAIFRGSVDVVTVKDRIAPVRRIELKRSAIDDLEAEAIGTDEPKRAVRQATYFERDDRVRKRVITRAKGKCEFCGLPGFASINGRQYIESHHIISLARQGPDTVWNVIGLCANHHREAHYGQNRIDLELKFQEILSKFNPKDI